MLETGECTVSELCDTLMPACRMGTTATDICNAFEEFLVDLPVERLEAIRSLRDAGFKAFVLSNTNPIMYNHWIENAFRKEGLTVNDYFDGIVVSFQERTCKPDPQIFRNLVSRYHLAVEETVLLDDSEANCESARSIGLQCRAGQEGGSRLHPQHLPSPQGGRRGEVSAAAAAVGTFDGVHRGHIAVLDTLKELASERGWSRWLSHSTAIHCRS